MPDYSGLSIGRYHIIEPLGQGGMATVYRAFDTRLECDVAIKFIRMERLTREEEQRTLKRFEREAKELARLTHPNIVKVTDYGEYEGTPFLVMPYLPGGTLKQFAGKPMPYDRAARLLAPIAIALESAHHKNLIHRDVKPANILLTDEGQPMISDFGVAKILDIEHGATLTSTNMAIGTPEYMAPEQWLNQVSAQSDIYSLGVVFYELVTGQRPYTADTPAAIFLKQSTEPLPRPRTFVPGLPDRVEKVLFKALARKPEERYASMGEFAAALESLAGPIKAGPPAQLKPEVIEAASVRPQTPALAPKPALEAFQAQETGAGTVSPLIGVDEPPTADNVVTPVSLPVRKAPARTPISKWVWVTVGIIVLAGVMALAGWGINQLASRQTALGLAALTPTATPAQAENRAATATPVPTLIPTMGIGSTQISPKDGMLMMYVPAGDYRMGSDKAKDNLAYANELPQHSIYLDAFWIDQTEVTNAHYSRCVASGQCTSPGNKNSYTHSSYYGNSQYTSYPVIYVDWNQAQSYCTWAGKRLPNEAEWEKAARGTDGRIYPWGSAAPDQSLLNYNRNKGDTTAVGSYPSGASPYGALDMAGNLWEWVNDWYSDSYYQNSPARNPTGPDLGTYRVLRGGSWNYNGGDVRSANRLNNSPDYSDYYIGFRCAASATASPVTSVTPAPTTIETPAVTSVTTLAIGSTQVSPKDGMLQMYVPEGNFLMGSDKVKDSQAQNNEMPQHTVYLDAYWIDQAEVTNAEYARCVVDGQYKPPVNAGSFTHFPYYGDGQYANYPVINVVWSQALVYCTWSGRRLPNEAEWEKATRGVDGRTYPWPDNPPSQKLLNYDNNKGDTTAVGS